MHALFVATANAHKVGELRSLLGPGFLVLSLRDTNARIDVVESAESFAGNALLKAVAWAAYLGADTCGLGAGWVLADDSGLEVDALDGAPGVLSARFAALDSGVPGNSPDAANNAKLLRLLAETPDERRTARFRCVLALVPVQPGASAADLAAQARFFEGSCPGRIRREATGSAGFGYDPLFVPEGHHQSFAELGDDTKNRLSHRAKAVEAFRRHWARA
ncbi:MAG: non-canonical purine NTP pyrophosphatase [Verrucomicrobia bacterium]|nr:MAG: non-canonical purine NTP pyrophosphatase [Verrucomicrobiota bacterium]